MLDSSVEITNYCPPDTVETFLEELNHSQGDDLDDQETAPAPPRASSDWSTRKSLLSERWEKERACLVNTMAAQQNVTTQICQQCGSSPAAVRCRDCRPQPFFCADCDVSIHRNHVFHNRDATIAGFFQPLPPTTCVVERALSQCVCIVPLEMPKKICSCSPGSLSVNTGKVVAVVTMNGRYDLSMPEMKCEACKATWSPGVDDLVRNDYWPATFHFSTVYSIDVFYSYEELKMAAPGLSCQAFLRMLDQRTVRFGRIGKITADSFRKSFLEWEAVRFEVDKICREEHFVCPACTPDMLAVSVDGNRKHYRFKNAARSEEKALFDGIFIAKDDEVERFVDYIHSTTNHVSGRGVCGGEWSAARETSQKSSSKIDEEGLELAVCRHGVFLAALNMFRGEIYAYPLYLQNKLANTPISFFAMDVTCKYWPYLNKVTKSCPELQHLLSMKPFLSVFHAKAHDFKCEVKWSGAYQQGAGLTLGEEVEQCNAFLSRIAVTTKHMSKAGRTDMLTLMAMRWNQQKFNNLATSLACRYQKATKRLESQLQDLESMRIQLAVTQVEVEGWVTDIKEWAEATTSQKNADLDAVINRMEVLVASIKRRSQRLYKDTDGSKGRARIRCKIREEKAILSSVVEKYNSMVPDTERIAFDIILSDETVWPWQLSHGDAVDLKTKRKAFDVVMAIRRLEEEKKIVLSEMAKHWKSLSTRADTLKEMSCQLSSEALKSELWDLNEEGIKGFLSLTLRKKQEVTRMMKHTRDCYAKVLTGTRMDFQNDWDEYDSDSELSDEFEELSSEK
ncbi:uncharacterized protein LOC132106020 isoform X1 [Carassius carassius]|uniref:uncharacterized protein LOC132106020 isoform X1 n=1 Tax=Carassius carassius TaxID=217509 RepID=UPI002868AD5B|nr:uncharacterized protein LOC132106020 isoform X1 [Carassius carassius]